MDGRKSVYDHGFAHVGHDRGLGAGGEFGEQVGVLADWRREVAECRAGNYAACGR